MEGAVFHGAVMKGSSEGVMFAQRSGRGMGHGRNGGRRPAAFAIIRPRTLDPFSHCQLKYLDKI